MKKNLKLFSFLCLISLVLFVACGGNAEEQSTTNDSLVNMETKTEIKIANDTIVYFSFFSEKDVKCAIQYPKEKAEACILLLHGWNLPSEEWCEKTGFCERAKAENYVLIIPDFGKTNYGLEVYPQTIDSYAIYPSLQWMMNEFIPQLQEQYNLLQEEQYNFVAGISTGGRGASLFAYHMPEIFSGAASLSGDFDIYDLKDEYIFYSFFGKYDDFPARWEKQAFVNDCENYIVPTYIGHGRNDNVADVSHSIKMYDSIKKHQPNMLLECHFPDTAEHNYAYWNSEIENVLRFFNSVKNEE